MGISGVVRVRLVGQAAAAARSVGLRRARALRRDRLHARRCPTGRLPVSRSVPRGQRSSAARGRSERPESQHIAVHHTQTASWVIVVVFIDNQLSRRSHRRSGRRHPNPLLPIGTTTTPKACHHRCSTASSSWNRPVIAHSVVHPVGRYCRRGARGVPAATRRVVR